MVGKELNFNKIANIYQNNMSEVRLKPPAIGLEVQCLTNCAMKHKGKVGMFGLICMECIS